MKLIKKLNIRLIENKIYSRRYGLFYCNYCKQKVKKDYYNGLRQESCGCARGELIKKNRIIHGDAKRNKSTRLYHVFNGMKSRCYNKNSHKYNRYGNRGIIICDEWKNLYITFKKWALNNGYKDNLTIDRENNDGNYEPCNCRWVTNAVNSRNTRSVKLNWKKVEQIKSLKENIKISNILLGKIFNVHKCTIRRVLINKIWNRNNK